MATLGDKVYFAIELEDENRKITMNPVYINHNNPILKQPH